MAKQKRNLQTANEVLKTKAAKAAEMALKFKSEMDKMSNKKPDFSSV